MVTRVNELHGPFAKSQNVLFVPYKSFQLSAFSTTEGFIDPQDGSLVTARAVVSTTTGEVVLIDPHGNESTKLALAGVPIVGFCNAVKSSATLSANNVAVLL